MQYNKYNFHKYTFCVFQEVENNIVEKLNLSYKSKSGSAYYFTAEGVYRVSNHWGRAANCRWRLHSKNKTVNQVKRIGYANWTDFYPNNEHEKLYYIEVNWKTKEVHFQHKENPNYNDKYILRNAAITAKRIQTIREILLEENWAKYLIFESIENLRKEIVNQLIQTEDTFIKIKQNYS